MKEKDSLIKESLINERSALNKLQSYSAFTNTLMFASWKPQQNVVACFIFIVSEYDEIWRL